MYQLLYLDTVANLGEIWTRFAHNYYIWMGTWKLAFIVHRK